MGHKRKSQPSPAPEELLKKPHSSQIQKQWGMDSNADEGTATTSEVKEEK